MKEDEAAIQFHEVNFATKELTILKSITGSFVRGGITTLVGPSGAGKSTLFRLCNGLLSASSGGIWIDGIAIDDYEPVQLRREIGIVLQSATMIAGTVRDNLELPRALQGESLTDNEAEEYIKVVGLGKEFLTRNSHDLSGGQKQRVSIARTLVNRPKILLLDEITSSLDRVSTQEIEELIVHINQHYKTTVIWITHHLDQALQIGTYTWVMMDGKLVESGPSNLLRNPENEDVRRFVKGEVE
ncbi:phosphate ABC transporter ATP-binding protein [Geomicrobium sediminis]|uniref:ABC transport system ATP-binding protein n=1 Tax=Geomicrobium sediminis TaxID=1347788 RepID=A0ABS2PD00_9BACL|nr:phosphate ABC transporter ATP-binding protein [Geomicrobium sediminis]MBM7633147.1 putative ABC transport system ATP-binding protein [Geomicrobium sediminis]